MSALDFLGKKKIPYLAFIKRCRGSGSRPNPVMAGALIVRYQCAYCGARFNVAEVQGPSAGSGLTPEHEAVEGRIN